MGKIRGNHASVGDLNLDDVTLESHPYLQYEGLAKVAFVSFIIFALITEVFLKVVLIKFAKSNSITEKPITLIFLVDRFVQGSGYIIICILILASLITNTPLVELFNTQAAAYVLVCLAMIAVASRSGLSLCMALYRLMCIKVPNLVMFIIGDLTLAIIFIICNQGFNVFLTYQWIQVNTRAALLNFAKGMSLNQAELIKKYKESNNEEKGLDEDHIR